MCAIKRAPSLSYTKCVCVCRHTARHREKASPSHAKSRDCVSASGLLPKGGGEKKFRRGMGSQVPSLKLGGGKKSGRGSQISKKQREGGREAVSALQTFYRGLDGQMSASAHFNDSITANSLKQEKEASRDRDLGVRLTEKTLLE